MGRSLVTLRVADPADRGDAEFLAELWADALRRGEHDDQVADAATLIETAALAPGQRLVIAEHDGQRAGAVLLRTATVTPINLDLAVQIISPHVAQAFRRKGVGRSLMESAVTFAEELGIAHVATAVGTGARESNRFMARLALGPHATLRLAPTAAVRARLTAQRPTMATSQATGRQLTRVLAARRSMRRSQAAG